MLLPGQPRAGQRFQQEKAPGMDRIEIKSVTAKLTTPAGTFESRVLSDETSPLGRGMRDAKMTLVACGKQ